MMRKNQKFIAIFFALLLMIFQPLTIFAEEVAEPAETEIVETGFEETTDEITEPEQDEPEEEKLGESVFPGLDAEVFSSIEDIEENKEELIEHLSDVKEAVPGEDFVEDEIVVKAPDEETALLYAEAFGGELLHFDYGFALIRLDPDALADDSDEAETADETDSPDGSLVKEAVFASADPDVMLPAAWPNYLYELLEDADDPIEETFFEDADASEVNTYLSNSIYNDPDLDGASSKYQWQHYLMQTEAAWRAGYTGRGVTVAVIDTGARADHEDMNIASNNRYEYNGSTLAQGSITDEHGHGTHCVGSVGAKSNNGKGGAGVAPDATMIAVNATYSSARSTLSGDAIVQGIFKATERGADVISLSLGGKYYPVDMHEAVENAYSHGVAVFCASGNDGSNVVIYPAQFDHAIAVGAVDRNNKRIDFSNQSAKVRYSGPGVETYAPGINSTSEYVAKSGTSMATPCVAGAAALILSSGKVTGSGPQRVENLLKLMDKCCDKSGVGMGTPNMAKFFGTAGSTTAPGAPAADFPSGIYHAASLDVRVSSEMKTKLYYTTDGSNITYKDGRVLPENVKSFDGNSGLVTVGGADKVVLRMMAVSELNGLASKVATYTYQLQPLVSHIEIVSSNGIRCVQKGGSLQLLAELTPSYAKNKKLNWEIVAPVPAGITINASGKISAANTAAEGNFTVKATAKDGSNISDTILITVNGGDPIASIKATPASLTVYDGQNMTTTIAVKQKSGNSMITAGNVSWISSDTGIARCAISGDTLTVTGVKGGKAVITGVANDGSGKKCTVNVTVLQKIESIGFGYPHEVAVGKSLKPNVQIVPSYASDKKLKWSWVSESHEGITLNATTGVISTKAKAVAGEYKIRATAKDPGGASGIFTFTVTAEPVKGMSLAQSNIRIFRKGGTNVAYNTVYLNGGHFTNLEVESSAPGIVKAEMSGLSKVKVTATGNATGKAKITVYSTDGTNIKKSFNVSVTNPVTRMYLTIPAGKSAALAYAKNLQLTPVFITDYGETDVTAKRITWSCNRKNIKVSKQGRVTSHEARGYADVTITATTADGVTATYTIYPDMALQAIYLLPNRNHGDYVEYRIGWKAVYSSGYLYADAFSYSVSGPVAGLMGVHEGPDLQFWPLKSGTYRVTLYRTDGGNEKSSRFIKVNKDLQITEY
ncbi:MAG: S8 family serine peptidase [Lachnospiraceae bacterium]|nr:S8 family serine peptidase [Lachnospiraceae bacterium]